MIETVDEFRERVISARAKIYWLTRGLEGNAQELIDWEDISKAQECFNQWKWDKVVKSIAGWNNVGVQRNSINAMESQECLVCGEQEIQEHYLVCETGENTTKRKKVWDKLKEEIQTSKVPV